jgi:hypothetical protein
MLWRSDCGNFLFWMTVFNQPALFPAGCINRVQQSFSEIGVNLDNVTSTGIAPA